MLTSSQGVSAHAAINRDNMNTGRGLQANINTNIGIKWSVVSRLPGRWKTGNPLAVRAVGWVLVPRSVPLIDSACMPKIQWDQPLVRCRGPAAPHRSLSLGRSMRLCRQHATRPPQKRKEPPSKPHPLRPPSALQLAGPFHHDRGIRTRTPTRSLGTRVASTVRVARAKRRRLVILPGANLDRIQHVVRSRADGFEGAEACGKARR